MGGTIVENPIRTACELVSFAPATGAVIAVAARQREPAILDSARVEGNWGRYTIVACEPVAAFTWADRGPDPFEAMRRLLGSTGILATDLLQDLPVPFVGGWIGYFGYESGRHIERLPATTRPDIGLPRVRFALYDSAAVFDHIAGQWLVVASDFPPVEAGPGRAPIPRPELTARLNWWKNLLCRAERFRRNPFGEAPPPRYGPISHNLDREGYMWMVRRAREYIAAGDIFQVNLARRETVEAIESPADVYLRLRQSNPGAYSAFLAWPGRAGENCLVDQRFAVLSSSPELFLDLRRRDAVTRPIKGTRPRSRDPAADEALRLQLAVSGKDRAELAMIVDLERNDLGRVCEYGSVHVEEEDSPAAPFALERHPTVHHLVATVTGRLARGRDCIDLLRATFPGGSITGAPKVRAMQISDELEPTERSAYTGAIGYFTPGRMVMNIAIRTMIQAHGRLHWYIGGGIVADSDPAEEYDETCAKGLGMRRALDLHT